MTYLNPFGKQNQPIPQSDPLTPAQVPNLASGYSFPVDDWTRLDRFLILGTEGGSYYATEKTLTIENASAAIRCIEADGVRVVKRIVEISEAGRAPKNEPAIFALAMAMSRGDHVTRQAAADALPVVCRTGTFLLHFAEYVKGMRGWGRGLRRAIGNWYTKMPARSVAFQAVKYPQRGGWSQRDLLRLAHPIAPSDDHNLIFHWIVDGWPGVGEQPHPIEAAQIIWASERARVADKAELLRLISDYELPREALPTEALVDPDVWAAMLPHLGLTALLRNLGNLSKIGLLSESNPEVAKSIADRLTSDDQLKRARIHPIAVLTALLTYQQGHGVRGKGEWIPVTRVVDALDSAFYKAFGNVQPSGARLTLALDVSGSMGSGAIAGVPGLTPRLGSAAMALVTAAIESDYQIMGFSTEFIPLLISPRQRLDDAVKAISGLPFAGTDCALPMLWALEHNVRSDAFVIYTDSETWAGKIHPVEALRRYREVTGIPARMIVVGMLSNGFSIADPQDAGMLDVVGFDTATPQLISDFIAGRL